MRPDDFRAASSVRHSFDIASAKRAIYFDYEGLPDQKPALLGWRIQGRYRAAAIDETFASCVGYQGSRKVSALDHQTAIVRLVALAQTEQRHLVSWSLHDVRLALPFLDAKQDKILQARYVDARQVARAWHRNNLGNVPPDRARLAYFGGLLRVLPAPHVGEHTLAPNLQTVDSALSEVGIYAKLPSDAKRAWRLVVKHNRADLKETADVLYRLLKQGDA